MLEALSKSRLFANMLDAEIEEIVRCGGAVEKTYPAGGIIFYQGDEPKNLHIIVDGAVEIGNDSESGRRNIINVFDGAGEMFGEVFLFVGGGYRNYAIALRQTRLMLMPKSFLYSPCGISCGLHSKLMYNMLSILAGKAYYLNTKLNIVSAGNLRHKIARLILHSAGDTGGTKLNMTREEMADYLNVARPSLSRELMRMQDEGLIAVKGRSVVISDISKINKIFMNL